MTTRWTGTLVSALLVRGGEGRRRVVFDVVFRVLEDGAVAQAFPDRFVYPAAVFRGLTMAQVRALLLEQGDAHHPPWNDVGAAILSAWESAAILRSFQLPYEFGP